MTKRLVAMLAVGALAVPGAARAATSASGGVPVEVGDELNLAGPGLVAVALLSTRELDAADVDPATIEVGDAHGAGVPLARQQDGSLVASMADSDGDGRDDLVVHVDKTRLASSGELTAGSDSLAVTARLHDGRAIGGADVIAPEVSLEVKFDEALDVRGSGDELRSPRGGSALDPVRAFLRRHRADALAPLVRAMTAGELAGLEALARSRSGRRVPTPSASATAARRKPPRIEACERSRADTSGLTR